MPVILQNTMPGDGRWAVWRIEESLEQLLSLSFEREQLESQLSALKTDKRKAEYAASRVLLQTLFGRFIQVSYHPGGKPFVVNERFHISISHTDGYAAAAIHPEFTPGIDIEYFASRVLRVSHRFLSESEISNILPEKELAQTLVLWSAKESVFKALGLEGVDFKNQLISDRFEIVESGNFIIREYKTIHQLVFRIEYHVNENFVLTLTLSPT